MWDKVRRYIDTYLNQTHMQSLTIFETLLQQSSQIQFMLQKLPSYKPNNILTKVSSQQLLNGSNKIHSISIVILRSINSNNYTFLLATQSLPTMQLSKYIFVVVVWPKQIDMITKWKEQLSLNMWVTIRQPYKYQRQGKVNYLIVRLENLVIQKGKRWKEKSQSVKQKANTLFKNKQFLQAFTMYEFALCNNHNHTKSYQRAILYSNSAACLYQLRLFQSSIVYCNMAIKSDPLYPKSYARKLNSLLQLSQYSLIPPCLLKLKSLLPLKQFEVFNEKFTTYMTNDIGIYNWLEIFDKKNCQKFGGFGEYHSAKIEIKKLEAGEAYIAREDIAHMELILVNKPLVYFKLGSNMKESSHIILEQVKKNCLLQKSFYETMKLCPPVVVKLEQQQSAKQHSPIYQQPYSPLFKHPVEQFPPRKIQLTLSQQQLKQKIQLSLFMQRSLQKYTQTNGYGIWRDLFYFPLDCEGNCTYIHLNNSLLVYAGKEIKKGRHWRLIISLRRRH